MPHPDTELIARQVQTALAEDLGGGDLTAGLIPADELASARVVAREAAVLCGQAWFGEVFRIVLITSYQLNFNTNQPDARITRFPCCKSRASAPSTCSMCHLQ